MVVPVASMRVAPDGIVTLPDVPIAVMRLPVMTMSALGQDLVALHRDDAGACQCEDTARHGAWERDRDVERL